MDLARFDTLTRVFASSGSRRKALTALLGAALLGRGAAAVANRGGKQRRTSRRHNERDLGAERKGRRKHKRKRKDDGKHPTGSRGCFDGSPCQPGKGNDLQHCDLAGSSILKNANCASCNLGHANLTKAVATGATLTRANLGNACLVDADLTGADVSKANISGAILCRTIMPNGSIDNSGCDKATACCLTCIAIGGSCGNGIGGDCCGGADCVNDVCACPVNKPHLCKGVCKACCDDNDCPGATPHCCNGVCKACCDDGDCAGTTPRCCGGVCRACCANSHCPSNACCTNVCCAVGQTCVQGNCCAAEPAATTCAGDRCGMVTNNCGQLVNCGAACAPIACNPGLCGQDHFCLRDTDPDLTLCSAASVSSGICCSGACVAGSCCTGADCLEPAETCCGGVCKDTSTDPVNCGSCGHACTSPGAPHCTNGGCVCATNGNQPCAAGFTCCAGGCKDLESDPQNCNACGHVCPSDGQCEFPVCTAGVCGIEISPNNDRFQPGCMGLVCCDGVCCNTFTNQVCAINHEGLRVCCVPSGEFSNGFFGLGAPHCCSGQVVGGDICA